MCLTVYSYIMAMLGTVKPLSRGRGEDLGILPEAEARCWYRIFPRRHSSALSLKAFICHLTSQQCSGLLTSQKSFLWVPYRAVAKLSWNSKKMHNFNLYRALGNNIHCVLNSWHSCLCEYEMLEYKRRFTVMLLETQLHRWNSLFKLPTHLI